MQVIPRIRPDASFAPSSLCTNGFTIGKAYEVRPLNEYVGSVTNDNGHERVVGLFGGPSAHIVSQYVDRYGYACQTVVGFFEVVA